MDPPGSGYRSETGGLMEALRVLTADQSAYTRISFHSNINEPNSSGVSLNVLRPP